jgi:hypothetical protein
MSFFEIASWKVFSIWLIAYRSESRCRASSEAELELDPPQPDATTRIAKIPPIINARMCRLLP